MRLMSPKTRVLLLNRIAATISSTALTSVHLVQKGSNTQKYGGSNFHTHAALSHPSERKAVASWGPWHGMGNPTLSSLRSVSVGCCGRPKTLSHKAQQSIQGGFFWWNLSPPSGSTSATTLHIFYNVLIQPGEYICTSPGSNTTILTFDIIPSTLAVFFL